MRGEGGEGERERDDDEVKRGGVGERRYFGSSLYKRKLKKKKKKEMPSTRQHKWFDSCPWFKDFKLSILFFEIIG